MNIKSHLNTSNLNGVFSIFHSLKLNPKLEDHQNFLVDVSWSSASFRSGDEKRYLETAPVLIEDCLCVVEKRRLSLAFLRTRIQISRHIRRKSWKKSSKLRGLGDREKDVFCVFERYNSFIIIE
ncbi:hypothetical protein TNIN_415331 [Trichonephila inaurata madagascariensis]|uniref:Uncharacterized protein n=1 Tax=Trichonephila inaurata madagascariensis TaxID=2747483 RepID=A0A8X6MHW4_9ARAC|nr:hypothetical protein TNIN_415331 [Trichonephila inaurata madagascariensis]